MRVQELPDCRVYATRAPGKEAEGAGIQVVAERRCIRRHAPGEHDGGRVGGVEGQEVAGNGGKRLDGSDDEQPDGLALVHGRSTFAGVEGAGEAAIPSERVTTPSFGRGSGWWGYVTC